MVSGWLGKCYFRIVTFDFSECRVFDGIFRSAVNAPTTGNTYAAYLAAAKALGSSAPVVRFSLVPLDFPCTHYFFRTIFRFPTQAR